MRVAVAVVLETTRDEMVGAVVSAVAVTVTVTLLVVVPPAPVQESV